MTMGNLPKGVVFFLSLAFLIQTSISQDVRQSLLSFYTKLSGGAPPPSPAFGWNSSSNPCNWTGVQCDVLKVRRVALEGLQLNGTLDVKSICEIKSLWSLSIKNNHVGSAIPDDFSDCKHLKHLFLSNNTLSGALPESISQLSNLKRLDISYNKLSGSLPDLARISRLLLFLSQDNDLSGTIPQFDFANLQYFNVSFNNFSGLVPNLDGRFTTTSLIGNPFLCGKPLDKPCPLSDDPPSPPQDGKKSKSKIAEKIIMFLGYILVGLVVVCLFVYKIFLAKKATDTNGMQTNGRKEVQEVKDDDTKTNSTDYKTNPSKSDYSITYGSNESQSTISTSLVILTSSPVKGIRFEDLLKAPAELLGRGRNSSVYKVLFEEGSNLAVKRIKEWPISSEEFQRRMEKINLAKHPNVLPPVAFYCSKQEKLIVYEYQPNGSLLKLLQGTQNGQPFDWGSRLNVASTIAGALADMHKQLYEEGIPHGNLKSSNIMMYTSMDACISEYGLMQMEVDQVSGHKTIDPSWVQPTDPFKSDVYNFGVILLELLTGKLVHNSGFDLARWVHSVVKEEWTVEVFDKALIAEAESEGRMVSLLQVALKCINPSPEASPSMSEVANMINAVKEEDERSMVSEV